MAAGIPPPPINSPTGSYYWIEWYTQLTNILNGTGYPWTSLNFTNSNIHDITTRHHNSLTDVQGGNAAGDSAGNGNAYHTLGFGYVDLNAVAANSKLPLGWGVSLTSTGVYQITMGSITVAPPNFIAGATSNTSGVIVQYVDVTGTNQFIVHTGTTGGVATNANFSFWVTKI